MREAMLIGEAFAYRRIEIVKHYSRRAIRYGIREETRYALTLSAARDAYARR